MKNKLVKALSLLFATSMLFACGKTVTSDPVDIKFQDFYDHAYLNEEYDMNDVVKFEDGIDYKIVPSYFDPATKAMKELQVRDRFFFTPITTADVHVDIYAQKNAATCQKAVTLTVGVNADPLDELLVTSGLSGWADNGMYKSINTDPTFIKGENSLTSINVYFNGSNAYQWGCSALCLHNFRCTSRFTATEADWANAVVKMNVFNNSQEDIEFELRLKEQNNIEPASNFVDVDWGDVIAIKEVAKPKVWSEIKFSLRHFGITRALTETETATFKDNFIIKSRYTGATSGEVYSYQYYVDDIDVVPASRYPDLDTRDVNKRESIELGFENCALDSGWIDQRSVGLGRHSIVTYDKETVRTVEHPSLSSLHLNFTDCIADNQCGYFVAYDFISELDGTGKVLPLNSGTMTADIYFSKISNKKVTFTAVDLKDNDWVFYKKQYDVTDLGKGWYRLNVDLSDSTFTQCTNGVRFCLSFDGVNDVNLNQAEVFVDNIFFSALSA